jgi:hypothetical protein
VGDVELEIAGRLEQHRTVATWLRWALAQEERTIRELEQRAEDERRRRETARRERSWTVTASRAAEGHPVLHRGNCGLARPGFGDLLDAEGVRAAVEEYPDLEMCQICRPWHSLGIDQPPTSTGPDEIDFP